MKNRLIPLVLLSSRLLGQPPAANVGAGEFSFFLTNDLHCIQLTAGVAGVHCLASANWMAANAAAYNVKAIINTGDYNNSPAVLADLQAWQDNAITPIMAIGLPTLWAPGNHDWAYGQAYNSFDAHIAPGGVPLYPWTSCFGYTAVSPGCVNPHNQYLALDVVAAGKIYRFGLLAIEWLPDLSSGTALATWIQGILDAAEPNRQFIFGTHMLVRGSHLCVDATDCASGPMTGATMMSAFLIHQPKIHWTFNGHIDYTPSTVATVTDDQHAIHSFARDGASGCGDPCSTQVFIMTFQPALNQVRIGMWNPVFSNNGGWTTQSYAWPGRGLFPMPGGVAR
jgi:hypothetical protein